MLEFLKLPKVNWLGKSYAWMLGMQKESLGAENSELLEVLFVQMIVQWAYL